MRLLTIALGFCVLTLAAGCDRRNVVSPAPTDSGFSSGHTPSITDTPAIKNILEDLHTRNFDALDNQLTSYQRKFEQDLAQEETVPIAFASFATADPGDGERLEEWVTRSPESFAAHLAFADYLFHQGWITRGEGSGSTISDGRMGRMSTFVDRGGKEVEAALRIDAKLTFAYGLVIRAARNESSLEALRTIAQRGLQQVPASFLVRVAFMEAQLPRWGGSYEAMAKFAAESQQYPKLNPRLHLLLGMIDWAEGCEGAAKDPGAAIGYYNRAIQEGDYSRFYASRGAAYCWIKNYAAALKDLNRAVELFPSGIDAYETRAWAQARLKHPQEVLADVRSYRTLAYPDSAMIALKRWALEVQSPQTAARARLPGDEAP